MAAPMQTFLYNNANELEGKKLGLIVSSASSGISGVERDAHRLIPKGDLFHAVCGSVPLKHRQLPD